MADEPTPVVPVIPVVPAEGSALVGNPFDFVPEKFRVNGADGKFDMTASARKLEEHRSLLEKRVGANEIPPKDPSEYKINAPEKWKEYKFAEDPKFQEFLKAAHASGYTQKQIDVGLGHILSNAEDMADGMAELKTSEAVAELRKTWKEDGVFKENTQNAQRASMYVAKKIGMSFEDVDKVLGNSPVFIRLMAALGPEIKEDSSPNSASSHIDIEEQIAALRASEGYNKSNHPEHKVALAKMTELYAKKFPKKSA